MVDAVVHAMDATRTIAKSVSCYKKPGELSVMRMRQAAEGCMLELWARAVARGHAHECECCVR